MFKSATLFALALIMMLSNPISGQTPAHHSPSLPPAAADLAARTVSDPRVRQYIVPARILWQSHDKDAVIEHSERLLQIGSGQIVIGDPACTLRNNGKTPALLLDFGR